MERKIKKLNQGSIMPDLKYRWGRIVQAYTMAHKNPNELFFSFRPVKKRTGSTSIPSKAFGRRAENSFIPNRFMLMACSQKYSGGFSVNNWKLIWGWLYEWVTTISRDISAKFISSQSKRCTLPKKGINKTAAKNTRKQRPDRAGCKNTGEI